MVYVKHKSVKIYFLCAKRHSLICRREIKELIFDFFWQLRLGVVVNSGLVADKTGTPRLVRWHVVSHVEGTCKSAGYVTVIYAFRYDLNLCWVGVELCKSMCRLDAV